VGGGDEAGCGEECGRCEDEQVYRGAHSGSVTKEMPSRNTGGMTIATASSMMR
jgi:hypothetical protein